MMTPHGYPPAWYHCLLDEQPYYLVPSRLFGEEPAGPLLVNPMCWFSWQGPPSADRVARLTATEHLMPSETVVWVDDPATRALWPYWVGAEYLPYLSAMVPGHPLTATLPPHVLWTLTRAGILVEPMYVEQRRHRWLQTAWRCAQVFQRGFASLENLIPPFHLGSLRRYYRYHSRAGSFHMGDDQVPTRIVAHNEGAARFFHNQLAGVVGDIAGTLVKPSYSYMVAYQPGSVLERHTDRDQCKYSITLCIDATPEPDAQTPWPIQLDLPEGALRIWQHLGEGLLYRGGDLPHYRDALPDGHTSTSMLFHYVDYDFEGALS